MNVAANDLDVFMQGLIRRNPGETEFHQAVQEVAGSIIPVHSGQAEISKNAHSGASGGTRPGGDFPCLLGR